MAADVQECVIRRFTATVALACALPITPSAAVASPSANAVDPDDLPSFEIGLSSDEYPGLMLSLHGIGRDGIPGHVKITAPAGFELYPARPPGSVVGLAFVVATDSSFGTGELSLLQGQIVAQADRSGGDACSPEEHEAVWSLNLSLLGRLLQIPIYIARENGELTLELCTPSLADGGPLLPLQELQLILPELRAPKSKGTYTWRALVTPAAPDRHTLLPDRAYELRALVPVPNRLTLHSRYDRRTHTAILRGSAVAAGTRRAHATVVFTSLIRKVTPSGIEYHDAIAGFTRTNAAGSFLFRKRISRTTGFIAFIPSIPTTCTGASAAPAGCLSTTAAAARSEPVTVSIPRH